MALNAVEWVGIIGGVGLAGYIGYRVWESTQQKVPDFSATQHKLVYGSSYIAAVNKAGGFNTTLLKGTTSTGLRVFVEGSYSGSTFKPNGKVYSYQAISGVTPTSTPSSNGGFYTTLQAIANAGYSFSVAAVQSAA